MQTIPLSDSSTAVAPSRSDTGRILCIDPAQFTSKFNEQHFVVEHLLKDHPLFEIPRLLELAQEVAKKWPGDL